MSNLLKEAIVDAAALREAALKNAETAILDKYSHEVRATLDQLLEQDELGGDLGEMPDLGGDLDGSADALAPGTESPELGGMPGDLDMEASPADAEEIVDDVPLAATDGLSDDDGTGLIGLPEEGEEIPVTVDLAALQEAVAQLTGAEEYEFESEDLYALLNEETDLDEAQVSIGQDSGAAGAANAAQEKALADEEDGDESEDSGSFAQQEAGLEEDIEMTEELIDAIAERLVVDMGATLSGWAGRSSESQKWEMEKELAHRRSTGMEDELDNLKKAQEELVFENKQLSEHLENHKQVLGQMKETLQEVNLSNARLLYTNRVLRNTSLNERQKDKIVEAISRAGSVTEARMISETLENAAPRSARRTPQTLNEAIRGPRASVIRASRQESTPSDPFQERMKRLAGIK